MSAKTWIDLTDMVSWSGHHGGTQRVVYGIANEYYMDEKAEVGFCVFNSADGRFYEYDFGILRQRVAKVASEQGSGITNASKSQQLKEAIVDRTPRFIIENKKLRKGGKHILKAGLIVAASASKHARKTQGLVRSVTRPTPNARPVSLQQDDTLLLLGKPWDTPSMMPAIAKQKAKTGFRVGAVLYDMVIPLYPHLHAKPLFKPYTQCLFELIQAADILFPISKSTKNDVEKFCRKLNLQCPPQEVIRLGDVLENMNKTQKPARSIAKEYILCVGTIEVRKNHALLYYAFKLAQERGIDLPQLIIVGRLGWSATDIYNLIKNDASMREKIVNIESVSDSELAWLYKNCKFTVYPSMYEGWGLPIAESLLYGKPCLASNTSSMTEIAGNLIDYFSPYNSEQCLETIEKYLDPKILQTSQAAITQRYTQTTWAQTYEQVAKFAGVL